MNMNLIPQTTAIQSSIGMSGYRHAFASCTNVAPFAVRTVDLALGQVALEPATATRQGWVRGTYAWSPPSV
jgi:hypothetical protein